jgi:hypothetical protein
MGVKAERRRWWVGRGRAEGRQMRGEDRRGLTIGTSAFGAVGLGAIGSHLA